MKIATALGCASSAMWALSSAQAQQPAAPGTPGAPGAPSDSPALNATNSTAVDPNKSLNGSTLLFCYSQCSGDVNALHESCLADNLNDYSVCEQKSSLNRTQCESNCDLQNTAKRVSGNTTCWTACEGEAEHQRRTCAKEHAATKTSTEKCGAESNFTRYQCLSYCDGKGKIELPPNSSGSSRQTSDASRFGRSMTSSQMVVALAGVIVGLVAIV